MTPRVSIPPVGFMLGRFSIRVKLAVLVGLLIASIALFVFWYFPAFQEDEQMTALAEKAESIVNMTAFTIAPALMFEDKDAMQESFRMAEQNPDLVYFVASDSHGRTVFSYNAAVADSVDYRERGGGRNISSDGSVYGTTAVVQFQNREIGRIFIGLSLRNAKARVANTRVTVALVSGGIFLVGVLSVLGIATFITVPLRRMVNTADKILQGNLAERAVISADDEVGMLARTFNAMVDNLTDTHENLAALNRTLEETVADRTKELQQEVVQRKLSGEALRRRLAVEEVVSSISTTFVNTHPGETDKAITNALEVLGPFARVDRAYVLQWPVQGGGPRQTHGWQASHLAPVSEERPGVAGRISPQWMDRLERSETILATLSGEYSPETAGEREVLTSLDLLSLILVPLTYQNRLLGILGLETITRPIVWTPESTMMVKMIGEVFVHALERTRAEEALVLAEQKYRSIFENAVVGIYMRGKDGAFITANPTLAEMLNYDSVQDLVNTTGTQTGKFYVRSGRWQEFTQLLREHGPVSAFESQVYRKDGSTIWISEMARALYDHVGALVGFEGTMMDITERKAAEYSTQKLLRAVEQTEEVVFMTELDGRITYVNPAFERLYGYSEGEVVGKTPKILNSGRQRAEYYGFLWRELLAGRSFRGEHINKTRSGSLVHVEVAVSPVLNMEHELSGFIAVQRDITSRREEEEKRKNLEAQLAQVHKFESLGTLAGGIAHDFNNILAIILGHVSLLQEGSAENVNLPGSLRSIDTAVQRGAGLVRQILTFARRADVVFEQMRPNEVVTEVVKMLYETFPKTITFETNLTEQQVFIEADRTQLHQTLLNLCLNARDAMPNGGVLTLSTEIVTGQIVRLKFPDAWAQRYVHITATDTGTGMDENTVRQIFEPFFTTKEKGKGTGLGLAVVYGIVTSHNGYIAVASKPGSGTTFSLYFPVVFRPVEVSRAMDTEVRPAEGGDETILIVEDEDMLRNLLESLLRAHGYTVLAARDGGEAVEVYRTYRNQIALVVTDMGLPKMSGSDAFLRMKELNEDVRLILVSGYVEPQLKASLLESGIKKIIHKPCSPNIILREIRETLNSGKAEPVG